MAGFLYKQYYFVPCAGTLIVCPALRVKGGRMSFSCASVSVGMPIFWLMVNNVSPRDIL